MVWDSAGVTDGNHRKLAKDTLNGIIELMNIIDIILIITIVSNVRIIVGFQGGDEGTFEGLGASVHHSTSGEQQQYTRTAAIQINEIMVLLYILSHLYPFYPN